MTLKVSHKHISSTEIQTFDNPFIKLDIASYLELLGIEPIGPQIALINAVNNPEFRFVTAMLSRRTGKTFISNIIAQLTLLVPGSNVLIISPNYSLSEISWQEQKKLLNHFNIERIRENAKDKVIELQNGSVLRMASVSQADSAVGRSYNLILFDEAALDDKGRDAFNVALRPTLDRVGSKAIFISTPRGRNYFHDFYQRGFSSEFNQWASIFSTWHENPRASSADIEEARLSMSRAEFEQEYLCNATILEGTIYEFNYETCKVNREEVEFDNYYETIIGMDVGYRDPTAIIVCRIIDDTIYIIDEWVDNTKSTTAIAEVLDPMMQEHDVDFCYVDSAAAQMRHDLAELHDIATMNAKKDILPGINYVASLIEQDRVVVVGEQENVLAMFENYRWDTRAGLLKEKPAHDAHSHIADALRYALYSYSTNLVM